MAARLTKLVLAGLFGIWGRGSRRSRVSDDIPFERTMVVSYRLSLSVVTIALSLTIRPQFAIECLRRSNQQGWPDGGHFRANILEEGVDRCKPNFNVIWERHGAVVCKEIVSDIFCRLSTMHERDRQTNRQTDRPRNGNIDRNRWNRLSEMSPPKLVVTS